MMITRGSELLLAQEREIGGQRWWWWWRWVAANVWWMVWAHAGGTEAQPTIL